MISSQHQKFALQGAQGFSLVAAVVSIAILGIMAVVFNS
jgi:type II secretory pathway pseudopilin PulG